VEPAGGISVLLRDSEVYQIELSLIDESTHDIFWLEVAMNVVFVM
jgi:hypothetical protein